MWGDPDKIIVEKKHKTVVPNQSQTYNNLLNDHVSCLDELNLTLKNKLFVSKTPINVKIEASDKATIDEVLDIDNHVLSNILKIFSTICSAITDLKTNVKPKLFNSILYYEDCDEDNQNEGLKQIKISKFLQILLELSSFVKHCEYLLSEIHCQFINVFELRSIIADIHFQGIFDYIGDLLYLLVELDKLLTSQPVLQQHWFHYRRSLANIKQNPEKYDCSLDSIVQLENICDEIESTLLSGKIFQKILKSDLKEKKSIQSCDEFVNEFRLYLNNAVYTLGQRFHLKAIDPLRMWSRICTTTVFYTYMFGVFDKKLLKQFTEFLEKVNHIPLDGNLVWYPEMFVMHYIGDLLRPNYTKKKQDNLEKCSIELMDITRNFPKTALNYLQQAMVWFTKSEHFMKTTDFQVPKLNSMQDLCNFFTEGIQLCFSIKTTIKTFSNLHSALGKPLTKTNVILVCQLFETLNNIAYVFRRHHIKTSMLIVDVIQYLEYECLLIIGEVKGTYSEEKYFSTKNVDIMSSLEVSEKLLHESKMKHRFLMIKLALNTAVGLQAFQKGELLALSKRLKEIEHLYLLQDEMNNISEMSCMYWHRVVFPLYFKNVYKTYKNFNGLSTTLNALADIEKVTHFSDEVTKQKSYESFINEINEYLQDQILNPMNPGIENELRLQVMTQVQFVKMMLHEPIHEHTYMIKLKPIQFLTQFIDTKCRVENYLSETFYDLTTVALHDWHNNGVMRTLAKYKVNLETVEDKLPSKTLEQGLDVLEIMRNLNEFVSTFSYNLSNQIFIENHSTSKHLNTINIRHMSNSIRIHGTGILSTAVNKTYRLLHGKLNLLSQYLYDERIKSKLKKEIMLLLETQKTNDMKYPFERAEKLNSSMKKLNLNPEQNYMDQFRVLVTHIGNALGYVRMIKSGGLHFSSLATSFIPDLKKVIKLEDLCKEAGFTDSCVSSGHNLDCVIQNICQNITEGTNYFKLLIDVFVQAMSSENYMHLRNFYILIPALTLNFIEHSINSKEKMYKKSKGAMFTDDGFAVGLAYLLRIFNLNDEFNLLKWFQSVNDNYEKKLHVLKSQEIKALKDDTKLQQPLSLSYSRLQVYYKEFLLLSYNINSARIFFQSRNIS
ncbi:WASH complex subunit 4 [Adelges cooleyi]|uniref:WASH complex subunit 4 n=1 Tax=Adelges cooleyi TaxID=133065 RepID=UPI00217F2891|nr:WASH complex subunit 4 [Adelges cooleyi]